MVAGTFLSFFCLHKPLSFLISCFLSLNTRQRRRPTLELHFEHNKLVFDPTRTNTKHRLSTTGEAFDEFILFFLPLVENRKIRRCRATHLKKATKSVRCWCRAQARQSHRRRLTWCRWSQPKLDKCTRAFGWSTEPAEYFTIISYQTTMSLTPIVLEKPKSLRRELNEFHTAVLRWNPPNLWDTQSFLVIAPFVSHRIWILNRQ